MNSNIRIGFQLEQPRVLVDWEITPESLTSLLVGVEWVSVRYAVFQAVALNGLSMKIGLHFLDKGLIQIELMQPDVGVSQSYPVFQRHLEASFGTPSRSLPADGGFVYHEWKVGNITITHSVVERFSLQELVLITRDER